MTGNVAEWCWELLKKNTDDELFETTRRAVLGGSFYSSRGESEISYLDGHNQKSGSDTVGFRMVRNAEELPEQEAITNSKSEPETKPVAEAKPSTEPKAESEPVSKEKKSKKDKKASAESEANAQDEASSSENAGAESDEDEDSDSSDDKKSSIFTKAWDKVKETKDKVIDGTHNVMDKMKKKKKK